MNSKLLIPALFLLISTASFSQKLASEILDEAYEQATLENKSVLLIFHASWCSWCKELDENLNNEKTKSLFEENYVITYLTVNESKGKKHLETPEANYILELYMGKKAGLPFWLIFDKNKGLIGNSYGSNGKNMGSPSTKKEVEDFKKTLKKTSKLTDEQLAIIGDVFLTKKEK